MKLLRFSVVGAFITASCLLLMPCTTNAQSATATPRSEYPRPELVRDAWQTLNGPWSFAFDDKDAGLREQWAAGDKPFARTIVVPFAFETKLSGIADPSMHDVVWYRRSVTVPAAWTGRRILLHFDAVNYDATIWMNGQQCGKHEGGQTAFSFDITDLLRVGSNTLTVRVFFPSQDRTIPRGKQFWEPQPHTIWYDRTEGIWQPVWIEPVAPMHIASLRLLPDVDASALDIEANIVSTGEGAVLRATASLQGKTIASARVPTAAGRAQVVLKLAQQQLWTPETPVLYDLALDLVNSHGIVIDHVQSYFGQRKTGTGDGRFRLNGKPYFLRMVLDQGYWPESLLTAPSDQAMVNDINAIKAMGFNGVRLHQKVEDARFLYWADRLGLAVWGEMANAQDYTPAYAVRMTREWSDVVLDNINHPSILAWVPLNESWGVRGVTAGSPLEAHMESLYFLTHSLDPTRPVVDNDGWEHSNATDLLTLHDYTEHGADLEARYAGLSHRPVEFPASSHLPLLADAAYLGQPILLTEFGGVAFRPNTAAGAADFGYAGAAHSQSELLDRLRNQVNGVLAVPQFAGYCYTQFSDVEQEINGLVTFDRVPKAPFDKLRDIFGRDPELSSPVAAGSSSPANSSQEKPR